LNYAEILLRKKILNKEVYKGGYIRINKIASIEKSLIKYKAGSLKQEKFNKVIDKIYSFLKN